MKASMNGVDLLGFLVDELKAGNEVRMAHSSSVRKRHGLKTLLTEEFFGVHLSDQVLDETTGKMVGRITAGYGPGLGAAIEDLRERLKKIRER